MLFRSGLVGDALPGRAAALLPTPTARIVFWDEAEAERSARKLLDTVSLVFPGHDRPFRNAGPGFDYLYPQSIALKNPPPPAAALARTIRQVRDVMAAHDVAEPFRMTAAYADGASLFALRYASDEKPPSLFYAEGGEIAIRDAQVEMLPGRGSILVLSEPLDMHEGPWREVPPGHVLESRGGVARVSPLPFV